MRVHHVGYIVKDIAKSQAMFESLGFSGCAAPLNGVVNDESRGIYISFIEKDGYCVELISPTSKESRFYPLMKKYKNCAYHFCYEADDIQATCNELTESGWAVIDPLAPAPAIAGKQVCFLLHPAIGIIELVQA